MDRTLFTPPMIETFRVCRRAYEMAFVSPGQSPPVRGKTSVVTKRFILRALAEINRGRIGNIQQVQKFLGAHWPSDRLSLDAHSSAQEENIQAFRFVYRVLTNYILKPYCPEKVQIAAVNLKVRARIPQSRVYLEDTFDLIYWHPEKKMLEFVDYHMHALRPFDPAWPSPALLVKQFLAERLRSRWQFDKLMVTYCQVKPDSFVTTGIELDESAYRLHWPELLSTVEEMKDPGDYAPQRNALCKRCQFLSECLSLGQAKPGDTSGNAVCRSA